MEACLRMLSFTIRRMSSDVHHFYSSCPFFFRAAFWCSVEKSKKKQTSQCIYKYSIFRKSEQFPTIPIQLQIRYYASSGALVLPRMMEVGPRRWRSDLSRAQMVDFFRFVHESWSYLADLLVSQSPTSLLIVPLTNNGLIMEQPKNIGPDAGWQ